MDGPENNIGTNIRRIRHRRGLSLQVTADLAGMSKGNLSRIENGQQALDRRSTLAAIARALRIAPQEITALPVPAPGDGGTDAAVDELRRSLMAVSIGSPGGVVEPVAELEQRVNSIRQVRRAGRFHDVGELLPALIRDVHTSVDAGNDVAELLDLAVDLHVHVTLMWLRDAGASLDLRWQAANIARDAARRRDDPYTLGLACYGVANALFAASAFDLAQTELDAVPQMSVTQQTAPLLGMLALTNALIAASDNRPEAVDAPMDYAQDLARTTGESDGPSSFGFGPTNVALWRMALALESGEPDRAVSIAEDTDPRRHPFATRQSAYWIDYGRALAQLPGQRDEAIRALRTAEELHPVRVLRNSFARETVSELLRRARSNAGGVELRGLASRMGFAN